MAEFFQMIQNWFIATQVPEQFTQVDFGGLFTNGYFLVPFIGIITYLLYKQALVNIFLIAVGIGVWYFTGTQYANEIIVNGELQIDKVLPIALGAVVVLGVVIYLFFGRSD